MTNVLAPLFTGETAISLSGVLSEVVDLLPIVLPVIIGFIAIRKGISFIRTVRKIIERRKDYAGYYCNC